MPVEQLPRRTPRSGDAKLVQYDEYIDRQIQNTRRAVKAVDIATALVTLMAGAIAFLLIVAVVEHWLLPEGFSTLGRSLLFAVLMGGAGYFAYRRLWPLVIHSINPVYAAQTIEHGSPSLKNSLINLLLFRGHRGEISDAVYKTLEEQAAQRLIRVPADAAVDRTQLIRFGYALLGIVAVAAVYKVLSPKDPLVSAERVLLPWADIVPASRVKIFAVEPGNVTISRGEFLDVSAEVRDIGETDQVLLRYTTADGQAIGKPISMRSAGNGSFRFECRLPEEADAGSAAGISQNLSYRIEAGDARSLDFKVKVVPAPSILVERIDYDYPQYTGYQDRSVEQLGDIRAIEGTRVTVHARANGPINEAVVDFNADGRRDLTMRADGARARAEFVLALQEDGSKRDFGAGGGPYKSYVLRFTNRDGRTNRNPVKYPIDVLRDYGPEVTFLAPKEKTRDVRLDETVTIEVEARDPDFALVDVRFRGEVPGRPAIDELLLDKNHAGRFTTRYQFTPSAHELRAGDVVQVWLVASDNRTPEANSTTTDRKTFRIVSPKGAQQPPPDRLTQRDQRRQPGEPQQGQQGGGEGQPQNGARQRDPGTAGGQQSQPRDRVPQDGEEQQQQPGSDQPREPGTNQQPQNGNQQKGDQSDQQSGEQQGQRRGEQQGQDDRQQQGEQDGQPVGGGGSSGQSGEQQQGEQNQTGSRGEGNQQSGDGASGRLTGREGQPGQNGTPNTNEEQTGAGAAGGEPSPNGPQPDGARPEQSQGSNSTGGQRAAPEGQSSPPQQQPQSEPSPISSEGDNDAEAFERIARHLRENGELKDQAQSNPSENQRPPGEQQSEDASGAQQSSETDASQQSDTPPANERTGAEDNAARQNQQGDGPGAETRPDDLRDNAKPQSDPAGKEQSPGGQQTASKGESGAGDQPSESQGTPNSQPETKPTEKWQQRPSTDEQKPDQAEPPGGARGKRESDSQGEQGGDVSGGGEQGGGQKAPREGTGSSGQNQSADEGAGESSERGPGNTSPDAGSDAVADRRTGQPGSDVPGEGSSQRAGHREGAKPGEGERDTAISPDEKDRVKDKPEASGEDATSDPQRSDGENQPPETKPSSTAGNQPGSPTGDQEPRTGTAQPDTGGTAPEGDEANLEYARKQTDLVLERLAKKLNEKQVDKELLDKLGWSREELEQFVSRWQQRKAAAQKNDASADSAQRELDEALRSLGLRPGILQQTKVRDDAFRDNTEGYRGAVPLEYQERLRAYNQGVSRSRSQGE